jgi:hypothetical protein
MALSLLIRSLKFVKNLTNLYIFVSFSSYVVYSRYILVDIIDVKFFDIFPRKLMIVGCSSYDYLS